MIDKCGPIIHGSRTNSRRVHLGIVGALEHVLILVDPAWVFYVLSSASTSIRIRNLDHLQLILIENFVIPIFKLVWSWVGLNLAVRNLLCGLPGTFSRILLELRRPITIYYASDKLIVFREWFVGLRGTSHFLWLLNKKIRVVQTVWTKCILAVLHSNMRKQFVFHIVPLLIGRPQVLIQCVSKLCWIRKVEFGLILIILLLYPIRKVLPSINR